MYRRSAPAQAPAGAAGSRAQAAGGREVFRLTAPVAFWWIWVAFAAANVVGFALQGASAGFAVRVGAILLTGTGLAYVLALRPRVLADGDGITVVNPFRVHHVPWAAVLAVDTGEWVRVHHAVPGSGLGAPGGQGEAVRAAPGSGDQARGAPGKIVQCWALQVSARAKRKTARARAPRRERGGFMRPALPAGIGEAQGDGSSRLPDEARYLASLPLASAVAVRLDARAARERAARERAGRERSAGLQTAGVIARWTWLPVAAVAIPAIALLAVALA